MGGASKVLLDWGRELSCHEGSVTTVDSPWHDWDSTIVTNRVYGLRHSPHLSRLHRAYFGDDVHDAGLPGSTTRCGLLPLTTS